MEVERLCKLGEKLGITGDDLRTWVTTQIKENEEMKERDRQRAIEEHERKEKDRQMAIEEEVRKTKEREWAKEEEELSRVRAERQAALLQKEIELLRLKTENKTQASDDRSFGRASMVKGPKLPCFDESEDHIDSYLLRFERYAKVNGWDKRDWAIPLSALLKGKALDVYTRMSDDDAVVYDKVKTDLLARYNLTEDGFKEKFRKSRPEQGERFGQFATRLQGYLNKWMELSETKNDSPKAIMDMFLKEQLVSVCSRELTVFMKERQPKSVQEVISLGEKYVGAHGSVAAFSKTGVAQGHDKPKDTLSQNVNNNISSNNIGKRDSRSSNAVICRICRRPGHMARDCRTKRQVAAIGHDMCCEYCRRKGHLVKDCWVKQRHESFEPTPNGKQPVAAIATIPEPQKCTAHGKVELRCGCEMPLMNAACIGHGPVTPEMPVATGWLNGKEVKVLRDSGSSCVIIRKGLINKKEEEWNKKVLIYLANGQAVSAPQGEAYLKCPYFTGKLSAVELESPLYDVILGNIGGVKCPGKPKESKENTYGSVSEPRGEVNAVQTRQQRGRETKDQISAPSVETGVSVGVLKEKQGSDETLKSARDSATRGEVRNTGKDNTSWYAFDKGLLIRYFQSPKVEHGDIVKQIVVPKCLRQRVMRLAHESVLSGHLTAKKTTDQILSNFYWPNIWKDVVRFCQSCDQCQRSAPRELTSKVSQTKVPLIDEPFSRVAVDLIGPIMPASDKGNQYILTVVDYCTRYPEAIALKSMETGIVAEGLVDIFSRTGIPREMLSDRGIQFTSDLMKEVCRLLSMKQLSTSPYHVQANGLVERVNGTLKGMLKRLAEERPADWDSYINAALFSYREAPQESLGFSPFELLFGRPMRGPMKLLRALWAEDIEDPDVRTTYQYVIDLREKMERTIKALKGNLEQTSSRCKAHFDEKAKVRSFKKGDKVLLLLPAKHNKLELKWQGPFRVEGVRGSNNYTLTINNVRRTYHVNLLKKYYERARDEMDLAVQAVEARDQIGKGQGKP